MRLVVVESPNKTRKIREFLGTGYRVVASFGHVRDLPVGSGLSVVFRDGQVLPDYVPLERSAQAIAALRREAGEAEQVLLATDPDREGEAIAWHVAAVIGRPCQRITFNAVTKAAVQQALTRPRAIDQALVDAQQARRVLDRVVGWLVSPTLRVLGKEAKSAGRVQSVALRFVAEREREIAKFSVTDYFTLIATLERAETLPDSRRGPAFRAELIRWKGEPLGHRLVDAAIAEKTVAWCRKQAWQVLGCERRELTKHPPPPFTTATVQQAASVRLKLAPEATMKLLQQLFEDGHITYHRTDSVHLEPEGIQAARAVIAADYPKAYLPAQPIIHGQKNANAQEAHEAIRPTHAEHEPALSGDAAALYRLIHDRFIACQMAPGRDAVTTIDVACAPGTWNGGPMGVFQAKGTVVLFDGWRRLGGDATDEAKALGGGKAKRGRPKKSAGGDATMDTDDEGIDPTAPLPLLDPGDALACTDVRAKAKSTKPPPRYTQASLIKKLEAEGIGRPSTYANILKTLLERTYVREDDRKLHATPLGLSVTDYLVRRYAGTFIEVDYTARLEKTLDAIAEGKADWQQTVTRESHAVLAQAQAAGLRWNPLTGEPPPWDRPAGGG